ncbi:MAG: hypothetical protein GXO10_00815 [Crenarchaeota archaeon]|nr:hypothetical protein [Thermoproteota archaeon]
MSKKIDPVSVCESYINQHDWRVRENANISYSLSNLLLHCAGSVVASYTLKHLYDKVDTAHLHNLGYLHIHDLAGGIAPYCAGWSLKALLDRGIDIGPSFVTSAPAQHLRTAVNHIVNFLGILSNEFMGACAFSDVDVLLAPYIYKDYINYRQFLIKELPGHSDEEYDKAAFDYIKKETEQSLQELIYHLNMPNRWGGQSPFTNIVLDLSVPKDMIDQNVIIADKFLLDENGNPVTYGQLQKFVDLFNKTLFELYIRGDAAGKPFTFPVITVNLTESFFKELDPEVREIILEANAKRGATYFQNCINGYMNGRKLDEGDSRAMCCMLEDHLLYVIKDDESQLCKIGWLVPTEDNDSDQVVIEDPDILVMAADGRFVKPRKIFALKYTGLIYTFNTEQGRHLSLTKDHVQPIYFYPNNKSKNLTREELTPDKIIQLLHQGDNDIYFKTIIGTLDKIDSYSTKPYKGWVYDIELPEDNKANDCFFANGLETHNCRLQIDVKEMLAYSKGLFSAGDYVGSVGVVTLNMAVVGYLSRHYGKQALFDHVEALMDSAKDSLLIKKKEVIKNLKNGLFPFTKEYLPYKEFESHFLTIGYCGLHECLLNYGIEGGILNPEGKELAKELLEFMNQKINQYKEETDLLFNLEATPAEGASYRLAKTAKSYLPDLIVSGEGDAIYLTNSCHLPAEAQGDYVNVVLHQNDLQPLHSGGTVVHFYLGSELDNHTLHNLLLKLSRSKLPYFTLTPVVSICPIHGPIIGDYEYCPFPHTDEEINAVLSRN